MEIITQQLVLIHHDTG